VKAIPPELGQLAPFVVFVSAVAVSMIAMAVGPKVRARWTDPPPLEIAKKAMGLPVGAGRGRTSGGQSHSAERATRESARPTAATISVALGRSKQRRILGRLYLGPIAIAARRPRNVL
jgi:hypothetical protein